MMNVSLKQSAIAVAAVLSIVIIGVATVNKHFTNSYTTFPTRHNMQIIKERVTEVKHKKATEVPKAKTTPTQANQEKGESSRQEKATHTAKATEVRLAAAKKASKENADHKASFESEAKKIQEEAEVAHLINGDPNTAVVVWQPSVVERYERGASIIASAPANQGKGEPSREEKATQAANAAEKRLSEAEKAFKAEAKKIQEEAEVTHLINGEPNMAVVVWQPPVVERYHKPIVKAKKQEPKATTNSGDSTHNVPKYDE